MYEIHIIVRGVFLWIEYGGKIYTYDEVGKGLCARYRTKEHIEKDIYNQ